MGKVSKVVVEVIAAHNLMPKDGQGSSSAFVEVDYGSQRTRTRTQKKTLNPVWNEPLIFDVPNPMNQFLQICVFHEENDSPGRKFLGKVKIHGSNIVKQGLECVQKFALEKRCIFSLVKGEIDLKIYSFDEEEKKKSDGGGGGEKIPQIERKEKKEKQEKAEKVQEATEKSVNDEANL